MNIIDYEYLVFASFSGRGYYGNAEYKKIKLQGGNMYNHIFYPAAFSADCKKIYTTSGMTIKFSEPFDLERIYKEFPEYKNLPVIAENGAVVCRPGRSRKSGSI